MLNDLLSLGILAHPTTDADAVFWPDSYRFCKLISDTIKTAVDIGRGQEPEA